MTPGEDATSWRGDAASDCWALPVLFRKYQQPPTQCPRSFIDANVPPVACWIRGLLLETFGFCKRDSQMVQAVAQVSQVAFKLASPSFDGKNKKTKTITSEKSSKLSSELHLYTSAQPVWTA